VTLQNGTHGTDGQTDRQTECDAICGPLLKEEGRITNERSTAFISMVGLDDYAVNINRSLCYKEINEANSPSLNFDILKSVNTCVTADVTMTT